MLMRLFISVIFLLLFKTTYAQTIQVQSQSPDFFKSIIQPSGSNQGIIVIYQDEQVKNLMLRYVDYRRKDNNIPGYRIRIFSESGTNARQHMYSEKARFMKEFPEIDVYFDSDQVYMKLYVGDFRNKAEAFRAYIQIKKEFPKAFIVPTKINLPKV